MGRRAGAVTVAIDIWHLDVPEFLEMQTENGDQRRKAYDVFPQLVIPDEFMFRVEKDELWTLLDPHEVNEVFGIDLASLWGKDLYCEYLNIERNLDQLKLYKQVKAKDLFKEIMRSHLETGMPYLAFKDTINRANPNKHDGMIGSVNLCVTGDTSIRTEAGDRAIESLAWEKVKIWNGFEYSAVLIKQTATNAPVVDVKVGITSTDSTYCSEKTLRCTHNHKWHIMRQGRLEILETRELEIGDVSIKYNIPFNLKTKEVRFHVIEIEDNLEYAPTYCFTETKRNLGMFNGILTGQCTESFSNVTVNETAHCCNLISLNLANIQEHELSEMCALSVRALDNTIDLTTPPFENAKNHNNRYRTIGVGAMGLADWLAKRKYRYSDTILIGELFESIAYNCTKASMELAKERGAYNAFENSEWSKGKLLGAKSIDWFKANSPIFPLWKDLADDIQCHGIRNSHITAIAPNTASSLIQGCTASVLPVYSRFFYDKNGKGVTPIAPPFIKEAFWYYQENKTLDQRLVVKAIAEIQKWIDTGISMELLFNLNEGVYFPDETGRSLTAKEIFDTLFMAWAIGCKTVYYVRTVQKDSFKESFECLSCAN